MEFEWRSLLAAVQGLINCSAQLTMLLPAAAVIIPDQVASTTCDAKVNVVISETGVLSLARSRAHAPAHATHGMIIGIALGRQGPGPTKIHQLFLIQRHGTGAQDMCTARVPSKLVSV